MSQHYNLTHSSPSYIHMLGRFDRPPEEMLRLHFVDGTCRIQALRACSCAVLYSPAPIQSYIVLRYCLQPLLPKVIPTANPKLIRIKNLNLTITLLPIQQPHKSNYHVIYTS